MPHKQHVVAVGGQAPSAQHGIGTRGFRYAQCTAENWTELNWTGSFSSVHLSSVQFSAVHWTSDGRRRFLTVKTSPNLRRPSPIVAARRRFSSNDRHCVDWPIHKTSVSRLWRTGDDRRFSRRIVAGIVVTNVINVIYNFEKKRVI